MYTLPDLNLSGAEFNFKANSGLTLILQGKFGGSRAANEKQGALRDERGVTRWGGVTLACSDLAIITGLQRAIIGPSPRALRSGNDPFVVLATTWAGGSLC